MTIAVVSTYLLSFFAAFLLGNTQAAGAALLEGTRDALRFAPELAAALCLWSSVTELLERAGASAALAKLLHPLLCRLFPRGAQDGKILSALSENVGANILGLGNAATPAGIRAARAMAKMGSPARDELCLLIVLNTASLQLLPTTIASLRAAAGAAAAFDILPAVWFSSLCSLAAGLGAAALLRRHWP